MKKRTKVQHPTPRTDDACFLVYAEGNYGMGPEYADEVVPADFARDLERELVQALADIDDLKKQIP